MSDRAKSSEASGLTEEDMHGWLQREIADIDKAAQLRKAEASHFVKAYARSDISEQELTDRLQEYSYRWGDPLPGVARSEGLTDTDILAKIDEARHQEQLGLQQRSGPRRSTLSRQR